MKGISVLIPVYNFDPTALLNELYKQYTILSIPVEIIVMDDASSIQLFEQWSILFATTPIRIYRSEKNLGRAGIRNELIQHASFDWLLFLDADTFPCHNQYLQQYLPYLSSKHEAICGGTAYHATPPASKHTLRWVFGKAREEWQAEERNKHPFDAFTFNNLLIRKMLMQQFPLDASIRRYGHEDTLSGMHLMAAGKHLFHINNAVYHEGLDTNEVFLYKIEESVETLVGLYKKGALPSDTTLIRFYKKMRAMKINGFLYYLIKPLIPLLRKNLLSSSPSLAVLDVFKFWSFERHMNHPSSKLQLHI